MIPRWSGRAACLDADLPPEAWFPNTGRALTGDNLQALATCQDCPIKADCADTARHLSAEGIWAGKIRVASSSWQPTFKDDPRFVHAKTHLRRTA